jgi:hypothetical protein
MRITIITIKVAIAVIAGIVLGYLMGRYSLPKATVVDAKKMYGIKDNEIITNWPELNNSQMAYYVKVNDFNIIAPVVGSTGNIILTTNNMSAQIYNGTDILRRSTKDGKSYDLLEWDYDRKGIYDAILYDTLDNNGKVVGIAIDSDRDGQADIRVITEYDNSEKTYIKQTYYYINDNWYKKERYGQALGVIVNGKWREIIKAKRKFIFK